jgi:hypothetical protein
MGQAGTMISRVFAFRATRVYRFLRSMSCRRNLKGLRILYVLYIMHEQRLEKTHERCLRIANHSRFFRKQDCEKRELVFENFFENPIEKSFVSVSRSQNLSCSVRWMDRFLVLSGAENTCFMEHFYAEMCCN